MIYMGYKISMKQGNDTYVYIEWKPFNEIIYGCGPIVNGTTSKFPLLDPSNSKSDWSSISIDTILFKNGFIYNNLTMETMFSKLIYDRYFF